VDSGFEVYDLYSFYLQLQMDWDAITPALEFGGRVRCKYVPIIGDDPEWNRMVETMGQMIDIMEPLGGYKGGDRGIRHGRSRRCPRARGRRGLQTQARRHMPGPAPTIP